MWPIAVWPRRPRSFCSSKTWVTRPRSRSAVSRPWSETAIPADSWPAVLEREEAEVGEPGHVPVVRVDAEDAAHQAQASFSAGSGRPRSRSPPTTPIRRRPFEPSRSTSSGRAGDHRAAAALAEERERAVGQLELGADPGVERGLGEADREPAVGDVVRQGQERRGLPEEADERRLGREVERGRLAAELAVERLVLGAGERELGLAGEEDDVALLPRARDAPHVGEPGRRSRRPGSGGSSARRCRCRARRFPRRRGSRAPRRRRRSPRSPRPAPRRSRASRGCRS